MRTPGPCAKCRSPRLWHVDPVMMPDTDSSNVVVVLPGVSRFASGAAAGGELRRRIEAGRFAAWICVDCGYTEWYALEVNEALAALARNPRSGVRYYEADR